MSEDKVQNLLNLGMKSTECLREIGIYTKSDLIELGPVEAYIKLKTESQNMRPSLNLLYAMVGAVKGIHWQEIARNHKEELLEQLEGYEELEEEVTRLLE